MSKLKFTYFNGKTLGEPIAFMFYYGNLDFEDNGIDRQDWPKYKPKAPFGQAPILEKDGKVVNQSIAIARYVAKQVKLTGANDWEDLEIDAIVDTLVDLRKSLATYFFEKDPKAKEDLKGPLFKETIPFYFDRLETIAKNNKGHLAAGKLTWADFFFASYLSQYNNFAGQNLVENRPNLKAVADNVLNIPQVKNFNEKRSKN